MNSEWAEGYVRLPDAQMQRMVDVANYHVRCDRTPWSFPVGVLPSHWQGRYFGFDEMYIHQGLVSAGHLDDARHCPDFRYLTLPDAEGEIWLGMAVPKAWNDFAFRLPAAVFSSRHIIRSSPTIHLSSP